MNYKNCERCNDECNAESECMCEKIMKAGNEEPVHRHHAEVAEVISKNHWARLRINAFWGPWVKFPGSTYEYAEKRAMKMKADLLGWWGIRTEYQISSTVPMEE